MRKGARQTLSTQVVLGLWVLWSLPAALSAETFDRGEALYDNHCKSCHESWAHEREGRDADTLDEVRKRVSAWSIHSGLDWNDEEIDAVVEYLNRQFYRFDERG